RRIEGRDSSEQWGLPGQPYGIRPGLVGVVRFTRLLRCADVAAATCSARFGDAVLAVHGVGEWQVAEIGCPDFCHLAVDRSSGITDSDGVIAGVGGLEVREREDGTVCARNVHAIQSPLVRERPGSRRLDA